MANGKSKKKVTKKTNGKTALAKREESLPVPAAELDEMFGDSKLDTATGLSFNTIKIVRETAQFDLGNEDYVKSITGHILFKHRANQWWEIPFDERGEDDDPRPSCYSIDGIKAACNPAQAGLCNECKNDKFGSGREGRGKACRNTMRFLFLVDSTVLPIVIVAPPTSLSKKGSLQRWLNSVPNDVSAAYSECKVTTKTGGPVVDYWPAHVELSLEKATYKGDLTSSLLCVKTLDVVTPESDPDKLRQLFIMKKSASEVYQTEQQSYIESEGGEEHEEPVSEPDDDDVPI